MKRILVLVTFVLTAYVIAHTQEKMEVDGAIIIKNSEDATPAEGTIRFNTVTKDFEGWNGHQWMSLSRLREPGGGVTDADGNTYTTIKLGTQEWMVENLKTSKYNDNVGILNSTDDTEWSGLNSSQTGAWCYYDNDGASNNTYGKLYNWYAVNTGKLCPTDWHVPSHTEWTTLTDYLGGTSIAGGKMKEIGTAHWTSPNTGATNESGFTGLPGGYRSTSGSFSNVGNFGIWWSSTEWSSSSSWFRNLDYLYENVGPLNFDKSSGYSVRCVRD